MVLTETVNSEMPAYKLKIKICCTIELLLSLKGDFANIWMAYQNNIKLTALERENVNTAVENYEIALNVIFRRSFGYSTARSTK
jgi:hypothetical protein